MPARGAYKKEPPAHCSQMSLKPPARDRLIVMTPKDLLKVLCNLHKRIGWSNNDSLAQDRKELEEQEYEFLNCLLVGDEHPLSIDDVQLSVCSKSLYRKRFRAVERCMSKIARLSGANFERWFSRFAQENPSVHPDGPCGDAHQFYKFLLANGQIPHSYIIQGYCWLTRQLCYRLRCLFER